jgi:putative transposase
MKKSRLTEERIAYVLRQAEGGSPVADVRRGMGISEATFYVWKKKYASMGVSESRKLRQLEDENARLKPRLWAQRGRERLSRRQCDRALRHSHCGHPLALGRNRAGCLDGQRPERHQGRADRHQRHGGCRADCRHK